MVALSRRIVDLGTGDLVHICKIPFFGTMAIAWRELLLVFIQIILQLEPEALEVVRADDSSCQILCLTKSRHKHCCEYGNDRDNHQQLN